MIPVILSPINGKGVASEVYQWDLGQQIVLTGTDVTDCVVQWVYDTLPDGTTTDNRAFSPLTGETDYTDGGIVDIPDAALMQTGEITGYIYCNGEETIGHIVVNPIPREQPADYVSPDNTVTLQDLVETAVAAAVGPAVEEEVETQVGPAIAEALAGFAYGVETYASADDLPAEAETNTLAIVKPAPAWDREPETFWKGQYFRRLYYNESPPNPLDVLPEAHSDCEALIASNDDGQAVRPIIYFQAAWAHDFLGGNPGLVYIWGIDENFENPTSAAIYTPVEVNTESEGTPVHLAPGWYSVDINTGELTAGTFAEMGIPEFDFEPRFVLNPEWPTSVAPLGYHLSAAVEAFDNTGLGYFMAVTPYTAATVYHKTETGWEVVT